jgi:hypothetical protein
MSVQFDFAPETKQAFSRVTQYLHRFIKMQREKHLPAAYVTHATEEDFHVKRAIRGWNVWEEQTPSTIPSG